MGDKTLNRNAISEYIGENEVWQETSDAEAEINPHLDITSEDEIWMVQHPNSINIEEIRGHKIKLSGKVEVQGIECIAEEFISQKFLPLSLDIKSARVVPIAGSIIMRSKLKNTKIDDVDTTNTHRNVSFPESLKVRHPLLGSAYQEKLTLKKSVLKRLKHCKKTDFISNKGFKLEPTAIKEESCTESDNPARMRKIKKEKKRERSTSEYHGAKRFKSEKK